MKTKLHIYKPWPFRATHIKPENRPQGAIDQEYDAGRQLGAFLYTSVPSRIMDGLVQFLREKEVV